MLSYVYPEQGTVGMDGLAVLLDGVPGIKSHISLFSEAYGTELNESSQVLPETDLCFYDHLSPSRPRMSLLAVKVTDRAFVSSNQSSFLFLQHCQLSVRARFIIGLVSVSRLPDKIRFIWTLPASGDHRLTWWRFRITQCIIKSAPASKEVKGDTKQPQLAHHAEESGVNELSNAIRPYLGVSLRNRQNWHREVNAMATNGDGEGINGQDGGSNAMITYGDGEGSSGQSSA